MDVQADELPLPVPELVREGCKSWAFTEAQVASVERVTRWQAKSFEWLKQKVGRITGSKFHAVMTRLHTIQQQQEPLSHIPAIKYSTTMEGEARHKYVEVMVREGHKHIQVQENRLFVLKEKGYIGATPDGIVHCPCCTTGVLEIKCLLTVAHEDPNKMLSKIDCIDTQNIIPGLKKSHKYYSQVIAQMGVTGKPWCDFFLYSRHGFLKISVPFDKVHWQ